MPCTPLILELQTNITQSLLATKEIPIANTIHREFPVLYLPTVMRGITPTMLAFKFHQIPQVLRRFHDCAFCTILKECASVLITNNHPARGRYRCQGRRQWLHVDRR